MGTAVSVEGLHTFPTQSIVFGPLNSYPMEVNATHSSPFSISSPTLHTNQLQFGPGGGTTHCPSAPLNVATNTSAKTTPVVIADLMVWRDYVCARACLYKCIRVCVCVCECDGLCRRQRRTRAESAWSVSVTLWGRKKARKKKGLCGLWDCGGHGASVWL